MSMDGGKLRRLLATAEEQHRVHQMERSTASATVSATANWALITEMARELILQREDIYGSWEPIERAARTPHHDVITIQGHDDTFNHTIGETK